MSGPKLDPESTNSPEAIARTAFEEIARRFPALKMVENTDDPVEISITMPVQPGLLYQVWLCLQNRDELHFSTSNFWVGWFPCTHADRVNSYLDAVTGFLSGEYRVLEHRRGEKCYKAQLQKPVADGWSTIATSSRAWVAWFRKKTIREVRNA